MCVCVCVCVCVCAQKISLIKTEREALPYIWQVGKKTHSTHSNMTDCLQVSDVTLTFSISKFYLTLQLSNLFNFSIHDFSAGFNGVCVKWISLYNCKWTLVYLKRSGLHYSHCDEYHVIRTDKNDGQCYQTKKKNSFFINLNMLSWVTWTEHNIICQSLDSFGLIWEESTCLSDAVCPLTVWRGRGSVRKKWCLIFLINHAHTVRMIIAANFDK